MSNKRGINCHFGINILTESAITDLNKLVYFSTFQVPYPKMDFINQISDVLFSLKQI